MSADRQANLFKNAKNNFSLLFACSAGGPAYQQTGLKSLFFYFKNEDEHKAIRRQNSFRAVF